MSQTQNSENEQSAEVAARLSAVRARLAPLIDEVTRFWWPRAADAAFGGFHGRIDRQGKPDPHAEKSIVQQARHLWALSTWFEHREQRPELSELAASTRAFMDRAFHDPNDGEYAYTCTREGCPLDTVKFLYGQSFAIYALSTYGRVCRVEEASAAALRCFRSIDARAHDGTHGGYDQIDDPGWMTGGSRKETNTHIHLLEAFTALYEATGDAEVRARLLELAELIATRVVQPTGYAHQRFDVDFTRLGPPIVSYGHDIETCWLLVDALRALRIAEPTVERAAERVGSAAALHGFDPVLGGVFDHGIAGGAVTGFEKIWWAQFEGLCGLWRLFEITEEPRYLGQLELMLRWIEGPARDHQHGEWFYGVLPDGSLGPSGDVKGTVWKATYHNLRALLFLDRWIASWMSRAATPTMAASHAQGSRF